MLLHLYNCTKKSYLPGEPNDGKLTENTFQPIQSNFGSLGMHSKQRYNVCICSVILSQRHRKF